MLLAGLAHKSLDVLATTLIRILPFHTIIHESVWVIGLPDSRSCLHLLNGETDSRPNEPVVLPLGPSKGKSNNS